MSNELTVQRLLATATEEFRGYGYGGTDVNRIARRSGMAPTTFYRCFKDKLDIFLAVHEQWMIREKLLLRVLLTLPASDAELAETCVGHHRDHLPFRRSLRQLAYEEPRMRQARARTRLEIIAEIRAWRGEQVADDSRMASDLIQMERLADALAEGEFADMGLDERQARQDLADVLRRFRLQTAPAANAAQPEGLPGNDTLADDEALTA
jgi:AcrR family transcriptional regulator